MNRWIYSVFVIFVIFLAGGCNIQSGDQNAIRESIEKHLSGRSDLNLGAMEHDVKQVSIDRDQAKAQVEFRLKDGRGTMQVEYTLQRRDGAWTILNVQTDDQQSSRPGMDQPPTNGSQVETQSPLPSFRDLIQNQTPSDANSPPARHPASGETGSSGNADRAKMPSGGSY